MAVVSAPAETKGKESVATLLNRRVADGLDRAVEKAEKKGWSPNYLDYLGADAQANEAYYAARAAYCAD